MRLAVKLIGFQAFPEVQKDLAGGGLDVPLPDDATSGDLLDYLADKYGSVFAAGRSVGAGGSTRLSVFIDTEMVEDLQTRLGKKLRPQSEVTVSLLRPLRGG
jgi:hypothetical protein